MAAKRQRGRQPAHALGQQPAASPPPLTIAAWAAQVQALPAACDAVLQMLQQLEPGLIQDAIAGRLRVPVSEVQFLMTRSQASLKQAAAALAELEVYRRRLAAVVPQ